MLLIYFVRKYKVSCFIQRVTLTHTHKKRKLWEFVELGTGIETVKHILIKCAQYIKLVC